ncbi:MAG TPA: sulfotransferase [Anaerolineae bacterium]|nr:sulfotransferase [Anaerolineae bacterium]
MEDNAIVIVSGLPRSGTSMMMKMLEAGGVPVLTDYERTADEDNPKGYYEFERVKQIERDREWLPEACGKAVKMVSALLKHLPADYYYKVIFMRREMEEILASQHQMLVRRGEDTGRTGNDKMTALFRRHVQKVEEWIAAQPNIDVLYVHYSAVVVDPGPQATRINEFLGGGLDADAMAHAVDPSLYRQRA